jgi:hypothetical protein
MSWVATAIIGGAVVGGVVSARGANRAAQAQENSANQANETQWRMFEQNRTDMEPWRRAGVNALGRLEQGLGPDGEFMRNFTMQDFEADPGYGFRMSEGMKALQNSRAGRGMLNSGATLKAITRYGQDAASQEYMNAFNRYQQQVGNRYNRLAGVAGTGQTATQQVGNWGQNTANNVAGNQIGVGNARASGYVGTANAVNGALNQGMNWFQRYQAIQQPGGSIGYGTIDPTMADSGYPY